MTTAEAVGVLRRAGYPTRARGGLFVCVGVWPVMLTPYARVLLAEAVRRGKEADDA